MIRFIPAAAMLMLSGLAMAGNSVSSMFGNSATPMCETRDMPNIFNAVYAMQEYGALPDKNYDKNLKNIKVRTIGLGKIGFRPLAGPPESEAGSYADPAHPSTLYSVV
ncbi:MAG: hypothetical protein LBU76_03720, partial [Azoarcus sp.]|nr:hypothetical protein [Azoarcus sp.]